MSESDRKALVSLLELAAAVWVSILTMQPDERQRLRMGFWHSVAGASRKVAERTGRIAIRAEHAYNQEANHGA